MRGYRHDPKAYKPGDPLYVRVPAGWNAYDAQRWTVEKITPSGQIKATRGQMELRVSASGKILGEDGYRGRTICDAAMAQELWSEAAERALWQRIRLAGEHIEAHARRQDMEALASAMAELQDAYAALSPSRLSSQGEGS